MKHKTDDSGSDKNKSENLVSVQKVQKLNDQSVTICEGDHRGVDLQQLLKDSTIAV